MKKGKMVLTGLLVFSLAAVSNSFGAEVNNATTQASAKVPEVVVTASKIKENPLNVSSFVEIIPKSEIEELPAKNVGDIIPELGLGHTHKYPGALTSAISIRGIRSNLFDPLKGGVLILIDGQRASTTNLAKIPVENIERIEVVKGPFSVLYGTQAMGGVINIITKTPKKEGVHARVKGELGSWSYWDGVGEVSVKKDLNGSILNSIGLYVLEDRSYQGDYKAKGYGKIVNTSYKNNSVDTKLDFSFLKNHHITLGFQEWKGWDIGNPGATYSPTPNDYYNKKRDAYDVFYNYKNLKIKYTYTYDKDESYSSYVYTKIMKGKDLNVILPVKTGNIATTVVGGEYYNLKVVSYKSTGAPYNPNTNFKNYGAFIQSKINVYHQKFFLIPGIRYDYFKTEILKTPGITTLNPRTETKSHVSEKLGLLYKINKNFSLKSNIGEAFRTPTPDELAADYVSSWGTRYLGNSTLKPEEVTAFDIGTDYAGNLGIISFDYFYNKYKNKIVSYSNTALNATTFKNIKGATIQGIEFSYSNDLGETFDLPFSLEPFINLTYHLQYKNDEDGSALLYIPKWVASFGFNLNYNRFKLNLTGMYNGKEKIQDWAPPYWGSRIVDKSSFVIFDLFAGYDFSKHFNAYLKIENLLNKKYAYVEYYPMPERSYYVGITYRF